MRKFKHHEFKKNTILCYPLCSSPMSQTITCSKCIKYFKNCCWLSAFKCLLFPVPPSPVSFSRCLSSTNIRNESTTNITSMLFSYEIFRLVSNFIYVANNKSQQDLSCVYLHLYIMLTVIIFLLTAPLHCFILSTVPFRSLIVNPGCFCVLNR